MLIQSLNNLKFTIPKLTTMIMDTTMGTAMTMGMATAMGAITTITEFLDSALAAPTFRTRKRFSNRQLMLVLSRTRQIQMLIPAC